LLKMEIALRGLNVPEISATFTQNDYIKAACEQLNMTSGQMTNFLWDKYHPANIWMIFTGIGIFTILGLLLYNKFLLKKSE